MKKLSILTTALSVIARRLPQDWMPTKQSQKRDCFVRPLFCHIFLAMTVVALLATPTYAADGQYKGGSGCGSAMAECAGRRLDDIRSKGSQYSGGPGDGSAMAEYEGRLDGGKTERQDHQGWLGRIIQFFHRK